MSVFRSLLMGTLVSLALGVSAQADIIEGSLSLAGVGVTQDGANLMESDTILAAQNITVNSGLGDFAGIIPLLTPFKATSIDLNSPDDGFGYVLEDNAGGMYGIFTATSGEIIDRSANYLEILMQGVFNPGSAFDIHLPPPGYENTPTTLRISINQSGGSLSQAITLESPAVPEPSSWLIAGSGGLVGLFFLRRRKARA